MLANTANAHGTSNGLLPTCGLLVDSNLHAGDFRPRLQAIMFGDAAGAGRGQRSAESGQGSESRGV